MAWQGLTSRKEGEFREAEQAGVRVWGETRPEWRKEKRRLGRSTGVEMDKN